MEKAKMKIKNKRLEKGFSKDFNNFELPSEGELIGEVY